ncbi:hypothetical protein DICSQDRAFT_171396 [Dichomitus squalens LYAD-421 SS1]|uniref:Uncharacterized protein n=1 Tax=Dichomitus squalens (strain LYAD-421) TaxID=732165 RepID=R7SVW4_DICSQ|nr:uncharacterized protein DICSQDRAFT_171396 [Dichomitus squalens LYAD-421 SS1]EJF60171.1 hypothetical protein DICSQDRAFT_171396 [Dichomitus squalens LYAD-421 SS1]
MEVLTLTGGRGANHILETQDLQSANAVRYGGNIHVIDLISGQYSQEVNVDFPAWDGDHLAHQPDRSPRQGPWPAFSTSTKIRPVINKVFDSEDARAAYDYQVTQQHVDRVFIEVSKD